MASLLLGILLLFAPPGDADDLDACLDLAPSRSPSPVTWEDNVQALWGETPPVPLDSVRAYLSQIRTARECFFQLNPSAVSRPYLGNLMRTYYVETALLTGLRRFSKAVKTFEEARAFFAKEPSIPSTDTAWNWWPRVLHQNEGYLHSLLGDLPSAIASYLQAYEATPDDQFGLRIRHALDVGILFQRTQDYRSARHYYNLAERHLRSRPSDLADNIRARVYKTQSDLLLEQSLNTDFERDSLKKAAQLARRSRTLSTPGSERYFDATMALSESLGYLGAFEEAYRLNEEVRQYAQARDDVRLQTFALLKLGVLHVQTERWAAADSVLQNALSQAQVLNDLDYQRRILRGLGRLHELQGHWASAESFYRQGVEVVEEYRESLTASQWSTTAFAQWRDVHRGLVRTLLAQNRPREALTVLDRSRARHLQDLRTRARVANQLPPEERVRFDSLSQALTDVRNRLGEASLSDSAKVELRNREPALMAARQQLLQIDSNPDRPSLDAISEILAREGRALVSYFLDAPWPVYDRSPRSVAFVLTGDTLRTVPLDLAQDSVDTHLKASSPLFTSQGKPDRANAMHFDLRPLHRLHEAVYAPVAAHLPDDRPLTVIPDGPLFHVPFSMLVESMPEGPYAPSEARYVLHERPTSLELASSLVADTAHWSVEWSRVKPELAAYGVSDFDTLRSVPSALRMAIPDAVSGSSLALPSLPGVERELKALQSTVPDARVALNGQVSEPAFCRSARSAGVLHVASHAFVNASSPLRNAILLQPERSGSGPSGGGSSSSGQFSGADDGILFLHELQGQQARIPMAVLSGCSTASGALRGGEGMEGLQYAFRAMGAQSTVSTLWPVSDQANVELMNGFYRHLQDGHPKDVALRQARLDFLESNPQKASPFFWAPPVLYGSPAALPFDDLLLPSWAWWGIALGGILLVLLLGWWLWTRQWSALRSSAPSY